jgi:hypothetical protein
VPQKIHEKLINKTVAGQLSGERKIIPLQKWCFLAYSMMEIPVDGNTFDRLCLPIYRWISIILWN